MNSVPAVALNDAEVKFCCATFYQSDVTRALLGDVFHPGGLGLTQRLGERLSLCPADQVLDVACGRGHSAVHLAREFGCHVTGLDYGEENVAAATDHAADQDMVHLTTFRLGDAGGLPFEPGQFDAIISECSFCTFPNKSGAAAEMARVLRPGGRLGLTDMTLDGPLPEELQTLVSWVACVAGAGPVEEYVSILEAYGFEEFRTVDESELLSQMADEIRRKLVGLQLLSGLGKLDLGGIDLKEAGRLARQAESLIADGTIGYVMITASTSWPG